MIKSGQCKKRSMMPDCRDARPCVSTTRCPDFVVYSRAFKFILFKAVLISGNLALMASIFLLMPSKLA